MTRKPYKRDITDAEWELIKPLIHPAITWRSPRTADMREIRERHILSGANKLRLGIASP